MRDMVRLYGPVVIAVAVVYLALRFLLVFTLPFLLAIALAVLIDPWVNLLEVRARIPRSAAAAAVLVIIIAVVSFLAVVGVAKLAVEITQFERNIPEFYRITLDTLDELSAEYGRWREGLPAAVRDAIQELQQNWAENIKDGAEGIAADLGRGLQKLALTDIPNWFFIFLVAGIATFFFSRDKAVIRDFLPVLVPRPWRRQVVGVTRRLLKSLVSFTNALLVLVVATAAVTTLGLALLGTPYALLLGIISGVLDLLPVVGPSLLFVPWIAYHLLFGDVIFGIKLAVVYGSIATIRAVLQVQVIGERIGIHPLTTLVAIYGGIRLLGPAGAIIGPFVVVLLKAMAEAEIIPLDYGNGGGG